MTKIAIVGGAGAMGSWFARFLAENGFKIVLSDIDKAAASKLANSQGFDLAENNVSAAKNADIVLVSVPIEDTVNVIAEIAPHMKTGSLLMDTTSVKVAPTKAMLEHAPEKVELIGMHPMFAPRLPTIQGQTIILTPMRAPTWLDQIKNLFENAGAKVHITTPEDHDRMMAVVQGLTHFMHIAAASALKDLEVGIAESDPYMSPIYELMLDMIARIVGQNPYLYAAIQMNNPNISKMHEVFLRSCTELKDVIEKKDVERFVEIMRGAARNIGSVQEALRKSDKIIDTLTSEVAFLRDVIGEEVAFEHIYSGTTHVGKVTAVSPETVQIETHSGRNLTLKLSNLRVLDRDAVVQWKKENFPLQKRDVSVLFPEKTKPETLQEIIQLSRPEIVNTQLIDVYIGDTIPPRTKSITIRYEFLGDANPRNVQQSVETLLTELGGKIR